MPFLAKTPPQTLKYRSPILYDKNRYEICDKLIFEGDFDVTMLQRPRKYPNTQDYPFQTFQKLFHKFSTSDTVKKNHHDLFLKIVQDANPKKQIQYFFKVISSTVSNPKIIKKAIGSHRFKNCCFNKRNNYVGESRCLERRRIKRYGFV